MTEEGKALCYKAKVKYSEEAITRLCKMQQKVYNSRKTAWAKGLCLAVMSISVGADMGQATKIIFLALGGILFSFLNYIPSYKAKCTIASMKGNFPEVFYNFRDSDILIQSGGGERTLKYSVIQCLWQDELYIYFFLNHTQAYMIDKKYMKSKDINCLLDFLSKKTGKKALCSSRKIDFKSIIPANILKKK